MTKAELQEQVAYLTELNQQYWRDLVIYQELLSEQLGDEEAGASYYRKLEAQTSMKKLAKLVKEKA